MDIEIKFAKIKSDAVIPTKRTEDKDYDIYACFDEDELVFEPHEIKLVPTGIASSFEDKYGISFRERGSNTKSKLITMAGEIDSGFRNEWFVAVYNTQHYPIIISKKYNDYMMMHIDVAKDFKDDYPYHDWLYVPYSKAIAQFAIEEVPSTVITEIPYEELKEIPSERGMGMLGSSLK